MTRRALGVLAVALAVVLEMPPGPPAFGAACGGQRVALPGGVPGCAAGDSACRAVEAAALVAQLECTGRCNCTKLQKKLDKVARKLGDAAEATKTKRCRRKLRGARKAARKLERFLGKLIARGCLAPSGVVTALQTTVATLRTELEAAVEADACGTSTTSTTLATTTTTASTATTSPETSTTTTSTTSSSTSTVATTSTTTSSTTTTVPPALINWVSPVDGLWSEPGNWSPATVPGSGEAVVADLGGTVTITHDQASTVLASLVTAEHLVLGANTTLEVNGQLALEGGADVRLESRARLRNALVVGTEGSEIQPVGDFGELDGVTIMGITLRRNPTGSLTIVNDLVLQDATVVVAGTGGSIFASMNFPGAQSLTGTGALVFGADANNVGGGSLTIGPGISVAGTRATVIPDHLVMQGTAAVTVPGTNVQLGRSGGSMSFEGMANVAAGSSLSLFGAWTSSAASTIMTTGGTLRLGAPGQSEPWANGGTIDATDTLVELGGAFSLASLGSLSRSGGTMRVVGAMDNGPGLMLDASTGSWEIGQNGRIIGGAIDTLDGTALVSAANNVGNGIGTLDGVTVNGTVVLPPSSGLNVENGVAVNGAIRLQGSTGSLFAAVHVVGAGEQTLGGMGEIVAQAGDAIVDVGGGTTGLRVGPGLRIQTGGVGIVVGSADKYIVNEGTVRAEMGQTLVLRGYGANAGVIDARGNSVVSKTQLPGGESWSNDGTIRVDSLSRFLCEHNFVQSAAGTFDVTVDADAAQGGVIATPGNATLAGTLLVTLHGTPTVGDSWIVVSATTVTGTFDAHVLPPLPGGLAWDVQYLVDRVELSVVAP